MLGTSIAATSNELAKGAHEQKNSMLFVRTSFTFAVTLLKQFLLILLILVISITLDNESVNKNIKTRNIEYQLFSAYISIMMLQYARINEMTNYLHRDK